MTSRKIRALTRLDPRLHDAIYGCLPAAAKATGHARSKASAEDFDGAIHRGGDMLFSDESNASLAAAVTLRTTRRNAEHRAMQRLNASAGNAAAFILSLAGEHRPSPMELSSVAAHEQASKAVRASSNVARRRLRMHIAAAVGMHLKDGVTDWDAAGVSALGTSRASSPTKSQGNAEGRSSSSSLAPSASAFDSKKDVPSLDMSKLRSTTVAECEPPSGVAAAISLTSLGSPSQVISSSPT